MDPNNQAIRVVSGERFTPLGLARKLQARSVLESATFEGGRARYSLLVVREAFRLRQRGKKVYLDDGTKRYVIKSQARDILDVLAYFADQHRPPRQDFPFPAGGIGFLSYEFATHCDAIRFTKGKDPLGLPLAEFIVPHVLVVFDHYTELLYLIGLNYKEHQIDLEATLTEMEHQLESLDFTYLQKDETEYPVERLTAEEDRDAYLHGVERIRDEIVEGNLLQGVLSRRETYRTKIPAIEAYRRLRTTNPAPYLVYLDFGAYQLFGASPEAHVTVKNGGHATMRPIAGTRRRGASEAEDASLAAELGADEKEKAEHLMLVDLARNDLGRVCAPGSVKVTQFQQVERYSRVMHLVSQVEGQLDAGKTGIDALRATFPAGTVSGAPKIRAIETIDQLEPVRRSFYAGVVGYVEPGGNLDTCITIRAGLKHGDHLYLQAGAGIVYDSKPEREYEETNEKLSALVRAIGGEDQA